MYTFNYKYNDIWVQRRGPRSSFLSVSSDFRFCLRVCTYYHPTMHDHGTDTHGHVSIPQIELKQYNFVSMPVDGCCGRRSDQRPSFSYIIYIPVYTRVYVLFTGIGYAMVSVSLLTAAYYNILIAYCFFFLFSSFTQTLPWSGCDHAWNTPACSVQASNNTGKKHCYW